VAKRVVLEELRRIQDEMSTLFERALRSPGPAGLAEPPPPAPGIWTPAVDVVELADELVLLAELPGVEREEIELTVQGQELVLAGTRRALAVDERYLRLERGHGMFRRSFRLPPGVDPGEIRARLERGVLEVRLAKRSAASGRRVAITGTPEAGS
jgi:HSP20 family protein